MTGTRRMFWAGRFYPADTDDCGRELRAYTAPGHAPAAPSGPARAGIVPHAGWVYSGATAGKVFSAIKNNGSPRVFIVLGAAHRMAGDRPAVYPAGAWETPLGTVPVHEETACAILGDATTGARDDPRLHDGEHSIEVQLPFIRMLFPDAAVVPVLAPPAPAALELGRAIGEIIADNPPGDIVAIASADLTHYGYDYGFAPKGAGREALAWVRDVNDKRFIDNAVSGDAAAILEDAPRYHNTCGAGAAAAAVAAARHTGATPGALVHYTTSHDVMPRGEPSMFVGYAGIVF